MPSISVHSSDFPRHLFPTLQEERALQFNWGEIAWAAITVGRRRVRDVAQHGQHSIFEALYRFAILWANLVERPNESIVRSSAYNGLDPSEKSAVSYFLGLTAAKLLASHCLNVPWLMHLDVYRNQLPVGLAGRSRPDLIGRDRNDRWIVVEAKGRTNGLDGPALSRAKEQARGISSIGGTAPFLRVGLQAHFSGGVLGVHWADPEEKEGSSSHLNLSREDLLEEYYSPMRSFFREQDEGVGAVEVFGEPYVRYDSTAGDIAIGMARRLLQEEAFQPEEDPFFESGRIGQQGFVGSDGLLVEPGESWSEQNMRMQPQERRSNW